jgi:Cu2+-containing amine oxidase
MPSLLHPHEVTRLLTLVQDQPGSTPVFLDLLREIKDRVVQTIDADPLVAERLAGARHRLIDIEFREEEHKVANAEVSVRLAEAVIYDYDRSVVVVAVTDMRTGTVESIFERRGGVQPALTAEERDEALDLVLGDDRYASLRSRGPVDMVATPAAAAQVEAHSRFGHRLFLLRFWSQEATPVRVAQAAVDLSTREVVAVDEAQSSTADDAARASND